MQTYTILLDFLRLIAMDAILHIHWRKIKSRWAAKKKFFCMKNTANQIISPPQGVRIDKRAHVRIGSGCGFPIFFFFHRNTNNKKTLKNGLCADPVDRSSIRSIDLNGQRNKTRKPKKKVYKRTIWIALFFIFYYSTPSNLTINIETKRKKIEMKLECNRSDGTQFACAFDDTFCYEASLCTFSLKKRSGRWCVTNR